MDLTVLQAVARELDDVLRGAFINKVYQPLPREIFLALRLSGGGGKKLVMSADPLLGRIHLTGLKMTNPPRPPRFCAFLRAHVQGGRILGIESAPDDRVVRIVMSRGKDSDKTEHDLVLELLGRDSNILVVSRSSNLILDCLHRIPQKGISTRAVLPGVEYRPPPQALGRLQALVPVSPEEGLKPGITTDSRGRDKLVARAIPGQDVIFPTMNDAAEAFYARRVGNLLLDASRRETMAPLKARIRALDRRIGKIRVDADRLERFAGLEEEGELLKANLSRVKKGMDRIQVEDWSTGRGRAIELDPAIGPVANLERIFKKVAKAKRGLALVSQRLEETLEEKRALEELLYFVEQAADPQELEDVAWAVHSRTQRRVSPREARQTLPSVSSSLFHTFQTPSGRPVLVGKSAQGNDYLLKRKAVKEDLWLHVSQIPGAHVLLRAEGRAPDPEDIAFCAKLAVTYSKARGKGKAEVIVAKVKDIERPKGALPGQVRVKSFKTVLSEGEKPLE